MLSGNFSRSVIVREWSSRHCFISIPRPWASLTLPVPTPTFTLDLSEERSLLLSWAGDMHNPNPGDENTVLISREVLRRSGVNDGELGIITQVAVPPPCTSVTVYAGSLADWQDLALNAEVAQSAFLSQVRILSVGQSLPLWLEGGVHITLTVNRIDPPNKFGVLHTLTQVEILPPIEHEELEEFYPITYIPSESEFIKKEKSEDEPLDSSRPNQLYYNNGKTDEKEFKNFDHPIESLMKYMSFRLQQASVTSEFTLKKDFTYGYRVLPVPLSYDFYLKEIVINHPSLIVISKQSLVHVEHQSKISFIARVKKIDSPMEKAEKAALIREDDRAENKQQVGSIANSETSDRLCTVIVWENFIEKKGESSDFTVLRTLAKGNSCIVSDGLRRLLKLESLSTIELSSHDDNVKTTPVAIDFSPVRTDTEVSIRIVHDTLKGLFRDLVDICCVVINAVTLVSVKVAGKTLDVFVTTRNGVPLKLSKESVVLLEMTHVADPLNIPHIPSSIADVDIKVSAKFQYLGSETVLSELQQHILVGVGYLVQQYKGVPQFALLYGSKGSGKTSLLETVAQNLSSFPYYFHFQIVSLKQYKGKKMETVEKKLLLVFREAVFRRPSVIVLDDLDSLVPSKGIEEQNFGPLYDHIMQMVNMLKGLLDDLLQFCFEDDDLFPSDNLKKGSVMIIATSLLRNSVHPLLVNPQGCHYFPCSFSIPPLEPEERVKALNIMLQDCHQKGKSQGLVLSHDCVANDIELERNGSESENFGIFNNIGTSLAMKHTENFVLPDISHLALRTYLQARYRWKKNFKQLKCCVRCGNVIVNGDQSTINSKLNLAIAENTDHKGALLINNEDLKAAREGYVPLALRGLELSPKETGTAVMKVGGLAEANRRLKEMLLWPSSYPNLFSKIKLRLRSGVLLYGPPGCGKTLIANSVAKNCQLNFISVKGPELLSKYIGASEQAVRDAFERASSAKPCILFFDEFESIAPRRGHDSTGVTDRVVNQLLTQMDGVEGLTGVYILAATSRPDLIDPALLRPGRLDKCVFCPMPTLSDREEILRILSEAVELGEEIDWTEFAKATENYSGADLQSLLATAQILVAQEALGEALYEGVIQSDRTQDHERNRIIFYEENPEEPLGPSVEKELQQIVLEKEKCRYIHDDVQDSDENIKYSESSFLGKDSEEPEKQAFKVYRRHLEIALKEVKPSVTVVERQKYEQLYSSFSKLREGNFGKHSPGKRATLA